MTKTPGEPVRVGVIGCGRISEGYLRNLTRFAGISVVACGDLDDERAKARAAEYGIGRSGVPAVVLEDDSIEVVVNLTVPAAHYDVSTAALNSGKSVFSEKPLALTVDDGRKLVNEARSQGCLLGCAPDTWLGGGLQTTRSLLEANAIGDVVGAAAFLNNRGAEQRRPDPEFYYLRGVGPLYDMGPYYVSALVNFLGPVHRVTGIARRTFPERQVVFGPQAGSHFPVEVDTHVTALMEFMSGPVATMVMSCDVWATNLPKIEVYGTAGSLSAPDPNTFGGATSLWTEREPFWQEVKPRYPYVGGERFGNRGLGVADLAAALLDGRPPRAGADLALHVLEVMEGIVRSSETGTHFEMTTTCTRAEPLQESCEFRTLPGRGLSRAVPG